MKLSIKVFKAFEWYSEHFAGMAEAIDRQEPIVYLLTNNQETKQKYKDMCSANLNIKSAIIDM
jgi:hypothetical protein